MAPFCKKYFNLCWALKIKWNLNSLINSFYLALLHDSWAFESGYSRELKLNKNYFYTAHLKIILSLDFPTVFPSNIADMEDIQLASPISAWTIKLHKTQINFFVQKLEGLKKQVSKAHKLKWIYHKDKYWQKKQG